jgi:hypothetical protein
MFDVFWLPQYQIEHLTFPTPSSSTWSDNDRWTAMWLSLTGPVDDEEQEFTFRRSIWLLREEKRLMCSPGLVGQGRSALATQIIDFTSAQYRRVHQPGFTSRRLRSALRTNLRLADRPGIVV